MAIKHGTTSITAVKHGTTSLTAVYHDSTKVFPDSATVSITKPIVARNLKTGAITRFTNSTVWLSTNSTATSGSTSGTFTYGTVVYGFCKLGSFHNTIPSGWTLISGTQYMQDAIYRTGSYTVESSSSYDLTAPDGASGTNTVTLVAAKKVFYGLCDDGVYSIVPRYGYWECWYPTLSGSTTTFSSSTTLTVSNRQSGSHPQQPMCTMNQTITYASAVKNTAYFSTINYDGDPLTNPTYQIMRISTTGTTTIVADGETPSISLSTTYAYFIFKSQIVDTSS